MNNTIHNTIHNKLSAILDMFLANQTIKLLYVYISFTAKYGDIRSCQPGVTYTPPPIGGVVARAAMSWARDSRAGHITEKLLDPKRGEKHNRWLS